MTDEVSIPIHADHLRSLHRKVQVVLDHVTAVALEFQHGFYLYGEGGIGKSYAVTRHLEKLGVSFKLYNSRMTGKGLFLALASAPDAIHVLEDMERLTKDPDAQGVLRSALWAPPGRDRTVTWTTASDGKLEFHFRGGIILISNRPMADLPELRALATRIVVHRLEVSEDERIALMRDLADQGYRAGDKFLLAPDECRQVTEHLIKECRAAGCPIDLRLQQKGFRTFRQWEAGHSGTDWRDLIAASVREATHHFKHAADAASPEEKMARKRNAVRKLMDDHPGNAKEQEKEYMRLMDASRADFFRRKREVESGEFDATDAA